MPLASAAKAPRKRGGRTTKPPVSSSALSPLVLPTHASLLPRDPRAPSLLHSTHGELGELTRLARAQLGHTQVRSVHRSTVVNPVPYYHTHSTPKPKPYSTSLSQRACHNTRTARDPFSVCRSSRQGELAAQRISNSQYAAQLSHAHRLLAEQRVTPAHATGTMVTSQQLQHELDLQQALAPAAGGGYHSASVLEMQNRDLHAQVAQVCPRRSAARVTSLSSNPALSCSEEKVANQR
jgi:hypothetical protein